MAKTRDTPKTLVMTIPPAFSRSRKFLRKKIANPAPPVAITGEKYRRERTLDKLISGMKPDDMPKDREWDTALSIGKETW